MSPITYEALRRTLQQYPAAPTYWIAYSGGLDSHVLLHLCARLRDFHELPSTFRAIHVHHGLQREADAWTEHCAAICGELQLPFAVVKVDARAGPGESPEDAARQARYAALRRVLGSGDIVLVAQHRDDQAETVLLQLMRGAGPAGLAAMPAFAPLEPGYLLRPFLNHERKDIHAYACQHGLRWIEDPSNAEEAHDRNFLRREIIPRLRQRWPGLAKTLARSAEHCAEAQNLLEDLAADLCRSALAADGRCLSVAKLRNFKEADRRLVLRQWLKMSQFRMPASTVIERIVREVLPARQDKLPIVAWREGEVRRYRDGLYLLPRRPVFDATAVRDWDGNVPLHLGDGNGRLTARLAASPGISSQAWSKGKISVRYRQGGERCRLAGRSGTHELKKLFQEAGILPWLRERAPLVYLDGQLAAIAGWWVCEPFAGQSGENNIVLSWDVSPEQAAIAGFAESPERP